MATKTHLIIPDRASFLVLIAPDLHDCLGGLLSKVLVLDMLAKPCHPLASGTHPSLLLSTLSILSLAEHLPPWTLLYPDEFCCFSLLTWGPVSQPASAPTIQLPASAHDRVNYWVVLMSTPSCPL